MRVLSVYCTGQVRTLSFGSPSAIKLAPCNGKMLPHRRRLTPPTLFSIVLPKQIVRFPQGFVVMMSTTAQLGFIKPLDLYKREKPYVLFLGRPEDMPDVDVTNVQSETIEVPLNDIRGDESTYTLDEHGFQYIEHHHTFQAFDTEARIIEDYLPEVERLIRDKVPYATKVHVYDWRVSNWHKNGLESFESLTAFPR